MKKIMLVLVLVLVIVVIIYISTKSSEKNSSSSTFWIINEKDEIPEVDVELVKGNISIAGSSTVYPVAEKLAEIFREDGYSDRITVESIGSGAGFERWTKGETDISNASRHIKDKEVQQAESIGRNPIDFLIGIDALVIVIHPQNDWLIDVDLEMLARIFSSDKWNDINPSWPDAPIEKFSPGTDSGTFDFFVEMVFHNKKEIILSSNMLQLSEDDNILSRGVQSSKHGIGYFGYAFYVEAEDHLKAVSIDGIYPSQDTIYEEKYPLARPLFMYSAQSIMQEKLQIAAFLAYTLHNVKDMILEIGYFPASEFEYDKSKKKWLKAMENMY